MPLTATFNGKRVLAHRAADQEWVALKRSYKSGELLLSCGQRAVPVTRKGTKFFSHHPDADMQGHEGHEETASHLEAKALIAEAAEGQGWNTTIEYPGPNRAWIADVLVERNGQRIALEVQWSGQTSADFTRRQLRYEAAGIKCFWFVTEKNQSAALEANVPHAVYFHDSVRYLTMTELFPGDKVFYPDIEDAVEHVLNIGYRRKFQAEVDHLTVGYSWRLCEKCEHRSAVYYLARFAITSVCGRSGTYSRRVTNRWGHRALGHNPIEISIKDDLDEVLQDEGRAALIQKGHDGELSFRCPACQHRIMGVEHLGGGGYYETTFPVSASPFELDPEMLRISHICRDVGRGRCSQRATTAALTTIGWDLFVRQE